MVVLCEADTETGVGQGGQVVGDVDVFFRHVDEQMGHGEFTNLFLFLCLEHLHKSEVLGGHFTVLVTEQYVVGGFLGDDDKPNPPDAEKALDTLFDGTDGLLVEVLQNDDDRVELFEIGHAASVLVLDKLVDGAVQDSISQFFKHGFVKELIRQN